MANPVANRVGTAAPQPKLAEIWAEFQGAFTRLTEELAKNVPAADGKLDGRGKGPGDAGSSSVDLRKMVADVVSAALLETPLLDKAVERYSRTHPGAPGGGGAAHTGNEQQIQAAVKEYMTHHLGTHFQGEIRGVIQKEMKSALASEDLKEMLDEKLRAVTLYLKNEIVPKAVQQVIARSH